MNKKLIYYFLVFSLLTIGIAKDFKGINSINKKITGKQLSMIKQAKTLQSAGLFDEAIIAYENIFSKYSNLREVFLPLKNLYLNNNKLDEALLIAKKYIQANQSNISSKIDAFDIYTISENNYWETIIEDILKLKLKNYNHIRKVISILLKNNKEKDAINLIETIRLEPNRKSFYSLDLGIYFSFKLDVDNTLDEYLLYLEDNPQNIKIIIQRIMLISNNESSINSIINKLSKSKLRETKIVHSKLEFKLGNYQKAYSLISEINNNESYKIDLVKDLIKIKNYVLSQDIINDILNSTLDKKILNEAVFQLASLYEKQIISKKNTFSITHNLFKNQILDSPFIKLNTDYSTLLSKAINIYDSLSTYHNDYKASFQLAEIKYKIIGDLDGAKKSYSYIFNNVKSEEYKRLALSNYINISFSKGDIRNSFNIIDSLYKLNISDNMKDLLDMKKIQIYYYTINRDSLIKICNNKLKDITRDNMVYNDILDISSTFSFYTDTELDKYIDAKFKIIQNKRSQAIEILESIDKNNNIYELANLESAYLEILQENYSNALNSLNNIDSTMLKYKERNLLLKAEIYDYGLNDISTAVDLYLHFLELFPSSIFYDLIRLRLRELAL